MPFCFEKKKKRKITDWLLTLLMLLKEIKDKKDER